MDDMDDVRRSTGIVADLSGWQGIHVTEERFKTMKLNTKETVYDPTEEGNEIDLTKAQPQFPREEVIEQPKEEIKPEPRPDNSERSRPGVDLEFALDPNELKSIAIRLMPTVDKIDAENYSIICNKAIEYAAAFLTIWEQKIKIGE